LVFDSQLSHLENYILIAHPTCVKDTFAPEAFAKQATGSIGSGSNPSGN
jgi:hypothetical protein